MDLFETAGNNDSQLLEVFRQLVASSTPVRARLIESLAECVRRDSRVTVNMRPWIAADFANSNRYQNMNQLVTELAAISGRAEDDLMRERLGDYYHKRVGFERSFVDGKQFRYGALSIGGVGPTQYGTFCLVLKSHFVEVDGPLAYLKMDSLSGYVATSGEVDVSLLATDVASRSGCAELTALKHAEEINDDAAQWPALVCSPHGYVEAIFIVEITTQLVEEVRISQAEHQKLWDLCFGAHSGQRLSEGEQALANDYLAIRRAEGAGKIIVREVPDA